MRRLEQAQHEQAGKEAADVRPPGDAAAAVRIE